MIFHPFKARLEPFPPPKIAQDIGERTRLDQHIRFVSVFNAEETQDGSDKRGFISHIQRFG